MANGISASSFHATTLPRLPVSLGQARLTVVALSFFAAIACRKFCSEKMGSRLAPMVFSAGCVIAFLAEPNGRLQRLASSFFRNRQGQTSSSSSSDEEDNKSKHERQRRSASVGARGNGRHQHYNGSPRRYGGYDPTLANTTHYPGFGGSPLSHGFVAGDSGYGHPGQQQDDYLLDGGTGGFYPQSGTGISAAAAAHVPETADSDGDAEFHIGLFATGARNQKKDEDQHHDDDWFLSDAGGSSSAQLHQEPPQAAAESFDAQYFPGSFSEGDRNPMKGNDD